MKSIMELYEEIIANEDMKKELLSAGTDEAQLKAFLERHGCSATVAEFLEAIKDENPSVRELDPEELTAAAGGNTTTILGSIVFIWGCVAASLGIEFGTDDSCSSMLD